MSNETHAAFINKIDCAEYQSLKDKTAKRPKWVGVPGGYDPTGRRHLYPAQTLEITGEDIIEAADKSAYAVTLDPAIEPVKGIKVALTDAKWKDAKPVKSEVVEIKTKE
jgi:hypothetical protein